MKEVFDTYKKRTILYKIISSIVVVFIIFLFACIFFSNSMSDFPYQSLLVILFLTGFLATVSSMFLFPLIKTYKRDGQLIITDSAITIFDHTYSLIELTSAEINSGDYNGRGTRGGLSDGSGNKITVTTKDYVLIKTKFVVRSKEQKGNMTQIMKSWKSNGFKIISNGIDLI